MMKNSKLIELLGDIPKSKEIKMYHPAVDDWVDFELIDATLYRMKKSHYIKLINGENPKKPIDVCKHRPWELYDHGLLEERMLQFYEFKNIKLVCNKTKNVSTFDRLGTINY